MFKMKYTFKANEPYPHVFSKTYVDIYAVSCDTIRTIINLELLEKTQRFDHSTLDTTIEINRSFSKNPHTLFWYDVTYSIAFIHETDAALFKLLDE